MLIRRSAALRIGRVDTGPAVRSGEMIDWLARGRELGLQFRLAPIALVDRRRIPGSISHGQDASALLPAVRAALERKRSRAAPMRRDREVGRVDRSNGAEHDVADCRTCHLAFPWMPSNIPISVMASNTRSKRSEVRAAAARTASIESAL